MLTLVLAVATLIPVTNEVLVDGKTYGSGSDLESQVSMGCQTGVYQPPASMGIIAKGQTVKVVGSDVKVELHMRGRCEKYGAFDYTVGKCTTDGGMETVSDEYTADHTIQSFSISLCGRKEVPKDESWEENMYDDKVKDPEAVAAQEAKDARYGKTTVF